MLEKFYVKSRIKCRECDTEFDISRDWQVFCSSKCKLAYNRKYKDTCFYCGERGTQKDHVHPFCARPEHTRKFSQEYVYACGQCNSNLGGQLFEYTIDRIQFLIDKYKKKYKLTAPAVEWEEDELEEMGPAMRKSIKAHMKNRRKQEDRVIFLELRKREIERTLA